MKLLSFAVSAMVALPLTFASANPAANSEESLGEFEQLTELVREYKDAVDRGDILVQQKVQQYDTDAKEVKPEEDFNAYTAAIADPFYGYQAFILVNKSVSRVSSRSRDPKTLQAQTLYLFTRQGNQIQLQGVLPVSTGKEPTPGKSDTREGFHRIQDAQKTYTSRKFGSSMPYSLWIESEYGIAIHQTLQTSCDQAIGRRASAGCVRLCPGDAEPLFNFVTSGNYPRTSPMVLLDKKTGVPIARGLSQALSRSQVGPDSIKGAPKVIRGYPILVRIIDGNTQEKQQEMEALLQNPTAGFQRYFKPIVAEVAPGIAM
ncbi:L,D-transpeptidase [Bdellovibrio sp. HCB337]|uniref:L,D-transpeptidase n=1 Tax=Bdellovibrio sp. HCB337 TaxID=3394358 RepID=UPI0039A5C35E